MKNYVIYCYEWRDPARIFVKEIQGESEQDALQRFRIDPKNIGLRVSDIKEGKWDRDKFRVIN